MDVLQQPVPERWDPAILRRGLEAARAAYRGMFQEVEAAIEGQGVAITREPLAIGDLASGALVRPFPQSTPDLFGIYLVYPQERVEVPKIAAFRDWISAEMHSDPSWHP